MRYYFHSLYQAKVSYTHLQQQNYKYLEDAVASATEKLFCEDPLNLANPCTFLLEQLPDSPDGALK